MNIGFQGSPEMGKGMDWQTHLVFNQPEPLSNSNLFLSDLALREAVVREHAGWDGESLFDRITAWFVGIT